MQNRNRWLRLATNDELRASAPIPVSKDQPAYLVAPPPDRHGLAAVTRARANTLRRYATLPAHLAEHAPLFSPRDARFLLDLCEEDDPVYFLEHVLCLAALTSRRGLPRNLVEVYLRNLSTECALTVGRPQPLERAAEELRIQREEILPNDRRKALIGAFSRQATADDNPMVGWFVTAAVADEANGIGGAVAAVLDWLEKNEVRTEAWTDAVHHLIAAAAQTAQLPR